MYNYDYDPKDLLRSKSKEVGDLLVTHQHELPQELKDNIMKTISELNQAIIKNPGFDGLDREVRNASYQKYLKELGTLSETVKQFTERGIEKEEQTETREDI